MRKSKFSDSQILSILKEYEQGSTAKYLGRKYIFIIRLCMIGSVNLAV